ncbi:MAG: DUF58 domain-containing protein [Planctomycetes bacterium]|nr:DUF58 domain-containing protein [Planctomycetota bacterium]
MPTSTPDWRDYLDPKVLAKIGGLELRARLIVEGFYGGMHRSPHRGASVEFADHRAYVQGDDLRHMDWRVFGRTDKYYIKEYEQETNLELLLVVDCSESMRYGSNRQGLSKHGYATTLAAAISYLALRQQDSVGLALFDEHVTRFIRPSSSSMQWKVLVNELAGGIGPAKTSFDRVLRELAERLSHRTLIILISDLFDDPESFMRGLKRLRYHHHEPIVWNVWDDAELTFPFNDPVLFDGLEETGRLQADPRTLRDRYLEEVEAFLARMKSQCGRMQVEYTLFNTSSSLAAVLSSYLATRNARLRRRSARVLSRG